MTSVALERPSIAGRVWGAVLAIWGGFVGLLPHVLHHVGPLAGAALLAGASGRALFAAIGCGGDPLPAPSPSPVPDLAGTRARARDLRRHVLALVIRDRPRDRRRRRIHAARARAARPHAADRLRPREARRALGAGIRTCAAR